METLSKSGIKKDSFALHPAFITELTDFLESATASLDQNKDTEKPTDNNAQLIDILPEVEAAVDYYDSVLAFEILLPVLKSIYGRQTDELLLNMSHAIERFDFEKTSELMMTLKGLHLV